MGLPTDLRLAFRMLGRNRGFAAASILTLTLAILLNTAVFGVVNAIWFHPLPFRAPDQIAVVQEVKTREGVTESVSYPTYRNLNSQSRLLDGAAAFTERPCNLRDDSGASRVHAGFITANAFPLLGIQPLMGRVFTAEEEHSETPVALISEPMWRRRFAGDPAVIGREIKLDGRAVTIIGVLPYEFRFLYSGYDLVAPMPLAVTRAAESSRSLQVLARLKPGVTPAQARDEAARWTATPDEWTVAFSNYRELFLSRHSQYNILLVAAGLVLLIACANVSNLFLAKAMARRKDSAIRAALGASRLALVRPLLAEGMTVALIAGSLALTAAVWMSRIIVATVVELRWFVIDARVFLYTLAVTVLAGLAFGAAPALAAAKPDVNETLKKGGRLRNAFVVAELAFGVMLLAAAGLLLQTASTLHSIDPGFRVSGLLTADISLEGPHYERPGAAEQFRTNLLQRMPAPAAFASTRPLSAGAYPTHIETDGKTAEMFRVASTSGDARYLEIMGIPLLAGRSLLDSDTAISTRVAVINEAMARTLWPGEPLHAVIGKRLRPGQDGAWQTIVGVTANARQTLTEPAAPEILTPLAQSNSNAAVLLVRADGDEAAISDRIRLEIRALDPDLPVGGPSSLSGVIDNYYPEAVLVGLVAFAGIALALASLGLYGVVSYLVTSRTREFGVRIALGAAPFTIVRNVVAHSLRLASLGAAIGILCALALSRILAGFLPGVSTADPLVFSSVVIALLAVATLSALLPAWRASRVDPSAALRT
jgi:putative ABC transport system permease protein